MPKENVNGYDVFENETVVASEPEPEETTSDDDEQ